VLRTARARSIGHQVTWCNAPGFVKQEVTDRRTKEFTRLWAWVMEIAVEDIEGHPKVQKSHMRDVAHRGGGWVKSLQKIAQVGPNPRDLPARAEKDSFMRLWRPKGGPTRNKRFSADERRCTQIKKQKMK